jgi:hypothetical protein
MPGPINAVAALRAENDLKLGAALEELADGPVKIMSEALTGLTSAIQGMVGTVAQFVQALSPSAMAEFGRALDGLKATIGSAFLPFVQIMSSVTREIAGVLLPTMQRLQPVIKTLSEVVGNTLLAAVKVFATGLTLLTPVIDLIAGYFQELSKFLLDMTSVVTVFVKTVYDVIASLFGRLDFKDVFKSLFDIVRQVTRALITLAATLAVFAGMADFVRAFGAGLEKEARDREQRRGGLLGAASNAQIGDIAGIMRQMQQAAFIASGAGPGREKSQTEYLRELSADLKKIADSKRTIGEALDEWWRDKVMGGLFGSVVRCFYNVRNKIENFFNKF